MTSDRLLDVAFLSVLLGAGGLVAAAVVDSALLAVVSTGVLGCGKAAGEVRRWREGEAVNKAAIVAVAGFVVALLIVWLVSEY